MTIEYKLQNETKISIIKRIGSCWDPGSICVRVEDRDNNRVFLEKEELEEILDKMNKIDVLINN